ncbi:MAG: hypothetical protein AAFW00_05245 [Bacteroidota bacterium]
MYRSIVLGLFMLLGGGLGYPSLWGAPPPQDLLSSSATDELERLWAESQRHKQIDSAYYYLEQSQYLWDQVSKNERYFRVVLRMSRMQILREEPGTAIVNLNRLLKDLEAREEGWTTLYNGLIHLYLGEAHLISGNWSQAYSYGNTAARVLDEEGLNSYRAEVWHLIGQVYQKLAQPALAKNFFRKVVVIDTYAIDRGILGSNLYQLGRCYQKLNRQDSATYFLEAAHAYSFRIHDQKLYIRSQLALAQSAFSKKNYEQALEWGRDALQKADQEGLTQLRFHSLSMLTRFYAEMKDHQRAFREASLALEFERKWGTPYDWQMIYQALGMAYLYQEQVDSATKYLALSQQLDNATYNSQDFLASQRLEVAYIRENMAALKAKNENQAHYISRQRFILMGCLGVIVLGFLLTLGMAYTNRERRRTNKILQEQNEAIINQKEEIQRLNEGLERIVAQRTRQLATQNKELEEYAYLHSHKVRAPLANILGLVEIIKAHPEEVPPEFFQLISKLNKVSNQLDGAIREINDAIDQQVLDTKYRS